MGTIAEQKRRRHAQQADLFEHTREPTSRKPRGVAHPQLAVGMELATACQCYGTSTKYPAAVKLVIAVAKFPLV